MLLITIFLTSIRFTHTLLSLTRTRDTLMTITLETINPPETGSLDLKLHLSANIQISPQRAYQLVSIYIGNQIADLLHGEQPSLVIRDDGAFWRVPVILSSRSLGRIGQVGAIDVNVETGELCLSDQITAEIETNADRLAIGAAL